MPGSCGRGSTYAALFGQAPAGPDGGQPGDTSDDTGKQKEEEEER